MSLQYISQVMPAVKFNIAKLATKQAEPTTRGLASVERLLYFVYMNRERPVSLTAWEGSVLRVYSDASFNCHRDQKSHTGVVICDERCRNCVYTGSNKQTCVTQSSTDAELVALCASIPNGSLFREVLQEFRIHVRVIHLVDNESTRTQVSNGILRCGEMMRHVRNRIAFAEAYFIDKENRVSHSWCETAQMVADLMTKCLGSALYGRHEPIVMGYG